MTELNLVYPPGPTDSSAALRDFQQNPVVFLCGLYQTYGDFAHYQLKDTHVYLINNPEHLRAILVELNDVMDRTQLTKDTIGRFLGEGLVVSAGSLHKKQRRTIQPVFTPSAVAQYAPIIVECTTHMLDNWQDGEIRDIAQDMMVLTMEIVYRTIFGSTPIGISDDIKSAITVFQQYSGQRLARSQGITDEQVQVATDHLGVIVSQLIEQHKETGISDLLSRLLSIVDPETNLAMSHAQVHAEALNLFVAVQEASANGLAWTWYMIAQHPEVEAKLDQELRRVVGGEVANANHLSMLTYVERVLKESMRLYPPAWLIGRTPTERVVIGGYPVERGASLAICSYVFHRNPNVFPEPERFIPDRFEQEPPRYTYLPFGSGAHVCIGGSFAMLEMALILVTVLQNYRFELVADHPIEVNPLITLRPKYGIKVKVIRKKPGKA